MINLELDRALVYLKDAGATINSVRTKFNWNNRIPGGIELLEQMLFLERVYLKRLAEKNIENLAHITIEGTGFPSLAPWLVDIEKLMEEFSQVRATRTTALTSLVEQFAGWSLPRIEDQNKQFSDILAQDYPLLQPLDNVLLETKELLKKAHQKYLQRKFPLSQLADRNNSLGDFVIYGQQNDEMNQLEAYKYLANPLGGHVLVRANFYSRYSVFVGIVKYKDLKPKHHPEFSNVNLFKNNGTSLEIVDLKDGVRKAFKKVYITTDYSTLSEKEISQFTDTLKELEELVIRFKDLTSNALDGLALEPDKTSQKITNLATSINQLIDCLPNEYLKMQAQVALKEAMVEVNRGVKEKVNQITPGLTLGRLLTGRKDD